VPVTLTQAALKKLLVAERAASRSKHKHSKFMSKTLGIYNGQQHRKRKELENPKATLDFTLQELRDLVAAALGTPCPYSGVKLSLSNLSVDHATPIARGGTWALDNLEVITSASNFRKGSLTSTEYKKFVHGLEKGFAPEAVTDIFRRLTLGGKWAGRQQ
jgi:5-methylcytosine-specific restriction endonuclease McrA